MGDGSGGDALAFFVGQVNVDSGRELCCVRIKNAVILLCSVCCFIVCWCTRLEVVKKT